LPDVRQDFHHADDVGRRKAFNIHGNHYRLVAADRSAKRRCEGWRTPSEPRQTCSSIQQAG